MERGSGVSNGESHSLIWVQRKKLDESIWVSILEKRQKSKKKNHFEGQIQTPVIESQAGVKAKILRPDNKRKKQWINEMCFGKLMSTVLQGPMTHSCGESVCGATLY